MAITKKHLRFKQIREYLGLTQLPFSNEAGLTQSTVSQIEKGARDISENTYQKLVQNLDVNRRWLETGEGQMFLKPKPAVLHDSGNEKKPYKAPVPRGESLTQGQRLLFFRKLIGISADQLADELNVAKSTYYKYEHGTIELSLSSLNFLHRKYRLNYQWLLDGKGNPKYNPTDITITPGLGNIPETLNVILNKIDYLEKQLRLEKEERRKLRTALDKIAIKI